MRFLLALCTAFGALLAGICWLSLFFLAACGSTIRPPNQLHVQPAPEVYELTQTVAEAINEAAGGPLVLIGGGINVLPGEYCGSYNQDRREIRVGRCLYDGSEPVVLVHEIGHAMGLQHIEDRASIMFPSIRQMTLGEAAASLVEELP